MNEKTKSIIRHTLTAVGSILLFFGLGKYTGIVDYILANLDVVWQAVLTISGFFVTLYGFFKNKERLESK